MNKKYLLAPGPVQVPPEVLATMAKPLIHHRTPQFEEMFSRVQGYLQELYSTKGPVLVFASSGTGAMEASIVNLHSKGDEVLVIRGGKFGERWGKICEAYDLKPLYIDVNWGDPVDLVEIEKILKENKNIKSVIMQYSETSTGTMNDIEAVSNITSGSDIKLIVDAITALGVVPIKCDLWSLDAVVGGSQKSLMLPPGLAFLWFSEKAWKAAETADLPRFYFNALSELKALKNNTTAWTPAVSLIDGLHTSLKMMKEEGFDKLYARNQKLVKAIHTGLAALNIELFSKSPSVSVTAGVVPEGVDGKKLVSIMKDEYGVTIAGGQDHLKGKIFRVGTLGYVDASDIVVFFATLEAVLSKLGYSFKWGAGTGAAQEVLYSNP